MFEGICLESGIWISRNNGVSLLSISQSPYSKEKPTETKSKTIFDSSGGSKATN